MTKKMKKAELYKRLKKGLVECQACAHKCKIAAGMTGVCGVRLNKDGKLYLTVYGKATGMALDPMEKKPLFHFLPGEAVLSFGTLGCDFGCLFCQNWWQSQPPREIRAQKQTSEEKEKLLLERIEAESEDWQPEKIVALAVKLKAKAIAYTYNEPAIFVEYAHDTAELAKKAGLKNVFVSNGYESGEALDYTDGLLDAINVDIKSFREEFYQQYCRAKLAPVLETVKRVYKRGIHIEVTTLIIPGLNDSEKELTDIAEFIKGVSPDIPWHVSAFHPEYKMMDRPVTPTETLVRAYEIGKKAGLKYVYVGNVADNKHESTYCPKCGVVLIERTWHEVAVKKEFDRDGGKCKKCGEKIGGRWK